MLQHLQVLVTVLETALGNCRWVHSSISHIDLSVQHTCWRAMPLNDRLPEVCCYMMKASAGFESDLAYVLKSRCLRRIYG